MFKFNKWKALGMKQYMLDWEKKNKKRLIWPKYECIGGKPIYHVNWSLMNQKLELWNAFLWKVLVQIMDWVQENKEGEYIIHYTCSDRRVIDLKLVNLMGTIDVGGVINLFLLGQDRLGKPYYIYGREIWAARFYLKPGTYIPMEKALEETPPYSKRVEIYNLESYFGALNSKNGFRESGFRFDTFGYTFL